MTPNEAALPPWFIIVRQDRPVLYQHLRESYAGDGRVEVILDRRRQAERRQTLATPQQQFSGTEGFFMVRRASGAPVS